MGTVYKTYVYLQQYLPELFLEWQNFSDKML